MVHVVQVGHGDADQLRSVQQEERHRYQHEDVDEVAIASRKRQHGARTLDARKRSCARARALAQRVDSLHGEGHVGASLRRLKRGQRRYRWFAGVI